jgi:putative ABC transport system permease protein
MTVLWQDLRRAARSLGKSPGTTAAAVVTLGLGIGALTAVFSWMSALLLRPYAFPDLDRLVTVWERHPQQGLDPTGHARSASGAQNPVAPADYLDLDRDSRAFESLSAYRYRDFYLTGGGEPELVQGAQVTPDLFSTLGVRPARGRAFLEEEGRPGRDGVVLVSDGFWRRRLAADPGVLGREVTLDERAFTVVGVLPADFAFPLGGVEVWSPLAFTDEMIAQRKTLSLRVVGRLDRSRGLETARAELDTIAGRLERLHPETNSGRRYTLVPLGQQQVGLLRPFLLVSYGAAAFVLLIACANVGSLLLARGAARQAEMAVRAALGGSRFRVAWLLLAESLILCVAGAALAVALARSGVEVIRTSLPPDIAKWVAGWKDIRVDEGALAFALGVALLTAVAAGLGPALRASGADLAQAFKEGGRGASGGRSRLRRLLVVSELTLALVLATGAGLMVKGFVRLASLYQGIDPEGVLTLRLRLPEWKYREPHQIAAFQRRVVDELGAMPGVESAALVSQLPADLGPVPGGTFSVEGRPRAATSELPYADFQTVSPAYFRAFRIPLAKGRLLSEEDGADTPPVVVVSDSLARRFWPGEEAVGRRVKLGPLEAEKPWLLVVGVVGDVKQYWFDREPRATVYLPYLQAPRRSMMVVLRTPGNPVDLATAAGSRIRQVDPSQPMDEVRTFGRVVEESTAFVRTAAGLLTVLALVACLLGAVGVHGLLAHHVERSRNEIGVRMALGADGRDVLRLVLGRALELALAGIAVGVPAAFVLGRVLASQLYGVVGSDPTSLAAVTLLLGGVAVAGAYAPARRAAALDPAVVIREG